MTDYFNADASRHYDEKNKKLAPIADAMHFLIRLVLKDLPAQARILCVGVGTGAEIFSLAQDHPGWSFTGIDPSAAMLDVCRARLEDAGLSDRCQLIHGYAGDAPAGETFDAALSILVAHFVPRGERQNFYQSMTARLKPGGYLVNTEISFDLDSDAYPSMLKNWTRVQALMGGTEESLKALPDLLRDKLCVLAPEETQNLICASGIATPVRFFQAFMITGWYGQK